MCGGCFGQVDDGDPWQAIETRPAELAGEVGPAPAPRDATCTLRVATWNLHHAPEPEALAAAILPIDADVLITQEIEAFPAEGSTRASRMAAALGQTWVYAPAREIEGGTHGLAMFSRYPLDDISVRRLPYYDQPVHPEEKIALAADVLVGEQRVRIVNIHLAVRLGPSDRIVQLDPAMNDVGVDSFLTGGDYNTNPWAWFDGLIPLGQTDAIVDQDQAIVMDDYMTGLDFAGTIPHDTVTFPVPLYDIRTDDLYARGFDIADGRVEHIDGSDHYPVWFDVSICDRR